MEKKKPHQKKQKRQWSNKSFLQLTTLAWKIGAILGISIFLGIKLDDWLSTNFPIFTLVLVTIGFVGAIYSVIKRA